MASIPSGSTLRILSQGSTPNVGYVNFLLSGTYTAADFTIAASDGLGFNPVRARVLNLTDRTETEGVSGLTSGLKSVAAGTRTYAAHGITFGKKSLTVDVSVAGPVTDNDTAMIEVWGS